jgi:hypothetical protein
MLVTKKLVCHLSVAVVALLAASRVAGAQDADNSGAAAFTVFFRGSAVGTERVVLTRTTGSWQIASTGSLAPPFDLVTTRFQMSYGADWQPQDLLIEGRMRGQPFRLATTFGITTASNEATQNSERASSTHQISSRAVILPNSFLGLRGAPPRVWPSRHRRAASGLCPPMPKCESRWSGDAATDRQPEASIELREFVLTFSGPSGPVPVEIWVDSRQRGARVSLPARRSLPFGAISRR